MIFKIDSTIIELSTEELKTFSQAVIRAVENLHFLDMSVSVKEWFDINILHSDLYLGSLQRELLEQDTEYLTPPTMSKLYLRTIRIGKTSDCKSVEDMLFLSTEPSVVVMENGKYDWEVLKRWVERYRKDNAFRNINMDVHRAVTSSWLRSHNAGGKNNICNEVDVLVPIYKGLHIFKIFTIFDSDKLSLNDTSKTKDNNDITDFLNKKGIEWHILQKRKIENYFPLSVYERAGLTVSGISIPSLTKEQLDFIDINDSNQCPFISMKKSQVKDLADNLTKPELQKRVGHIDGEIDEIQEIILKLAKFI